MEILLCNVYIYVCNMTLVATNCNNCASQALLYLLLRRLNRINRNYMAMFKYIHEIKLTNRGGIIVLLKH